jgi:RimJ/RimL family protein N-acetyltransferase
MLRDGWDSMVNDIKLRIADLNDCENVYHWRNAVEIRQWCLQSQQIPFDEHKLWFKQIISNKNSILLIAELETTEALGTVRFDFRNKNSAEISIYLVPSFIGKGLGASLLTQAESWLIKNKPEINQIKAEILMENERSKHLFLKEGYMPYSLKLQKEI